MSHSTLMSTNDSSTNMFPSHTWHQIRGLFFEGLKISQKLVKFQMNRLFLMHSFFHGVLVHGVGTEIRCPEVVRQSRLARNWNNHQNQRQKKLTSLLIKSFSIQISALRSKFARSVLEVNRNFEQTDRDTCIREWHLAAQRTYTSKWQRQSRKLYNRTQCHDFILGLNNCFKITVDRHCASSSDQPEAPNLEITNNLVVNLTTRPLSPAETIVLSKGT